MKYFSSMQAKLFSALALCVGFWAHQVEAQNVRPYQFSSSVAPYVPITNDTVLGTSTNDDQMFIIPGQASTGTTTGPGLPLTFTFNYGGVPYTRFGVNSNGHILLGNGPTMTGYNEFTAPMSSTTNPGPIICALGGDLQGLSSNNSQLSYVISGTQGNRVLTVQWRDYRHYANTGENYNFQIKLYQQGNVVEFHYGNFVKNTTDRAYQVGLRGVDLSNFVNRVVTTAPNDWANSVPGTDIANRCSLSTAMLPTPGQVYRFFPVPPIPQDLGVLALVSPTANRFNCAFGNPQDLIFRIKNYGTQPVSTGSITYSVNGGATQTQPISFSTPLAPNGEIDVTFSAGQGANLSAVGNYLIKSWTTLAGDTNNFNDTIVSPLVVSNPANYPTQIINTITQANTNGFTQGRGATVPVGTIGSWVSAFPFPTETIGMTFPAGNTRLEDWLISRRYNFNGELRIRYRVAVTSGTSGTGAATMGTQDTVSLMYTTDCGASWNRVRSFTQTDLANNTINNTLRPFTNLISGNPGSIAVAFFAKNNGQSASSTPYRFHLQQIEFVPSGPNLTINEVLSPTGNILGCTPGSNAIVSARVTNVGTTVVNSAQMSYSINGGTNVNQNITFNPALQPDSSRVVTFTTPGTISAAGTYQIRVFSSLTGDINPANDTIQSSVVYPPARILPSNIINTIGQANGSGFVRSSELVPATSTTLNTWEAAFPYTNPTENMASIFRVANTEQNQWCISPKYIARPGISLFWRASITDTTFGTRRGVMGPRDSVFVLISSNCGQTWSRLRTFTQADVASRNIDSLLREYSVELPVSTGEYNIAFYAKRAAGASAGARTYRFHLAGIRFSVANNIGVTSIVSPSTGLGTCSFSASNPVRVVVQNFGSRSQSTIPVAYRVNTGAVVRQTFNRATPLLTGQSDTLTFTTPVDFSAVGTYHLSAFTELPDDGNLLDDTSKATYNNVLPIATFPYLETFDNGSNAPAGWLTVANSVEGTTLPANVRWQFTNRRIRINGTLDSLGADLGTGIAWFNSFTLSAGNSASLVSPCFNFQAVNPADSLLLEFGMSSDNGYDASPDSIVVRVLNGNNLVRVAKFNRLDVNQDRPGWVERSVNITAFKGLEGVRLYFQAYSRFGSNMAIDYVRVRTTRAIIYPAQITIAHNFANSIANQVDVYLNDTLVQRNVTFRSNTAPKRAFANYSNKITFSPANSVSSTDPAPLVEFRNVQVTRDTLNLFILSGSTLQNAITGVGPIRTRARVATQVEVPFYHGSPNLGEARIRNVGTAPTGVIVSTINYNTPLTAAVRPASNDGYVWLVTNIAGTDTNSAYNFNPSTLGLTGRAVVAVISGLVRSAEPQFNMGIWLLRPQGGNFIELPKNPLGVSTITSISGLSAYPNPVVNGKLQLSYEGVEAGNLSVEVFNLQGKRVLSETLSSDVINGSTLNLGNLSKGLYSVRFNLNGKTETTKVVVE